MENFFGGKMNKNSFLFLKKNINCTGRLYVLVSTFPHALVSFLAKSSQQKQLLI